MAGGLERGSFSIYSKPLMPYKNSTLIESIMNKFNDFNLNNFIISLNYKEKLIQHLKVLIKI